jgi:hypothetical protein
LLIPSRAADRPPSRTDWTRLVLSPVLNGHAAPQIAKVVHLNQKDLIEKRDPNTAFPDRCATRVYTTPSIRYARMKVAALTRDAGYAMHLGKRLVFVLMCRQRSVPIAKGGYHMCGETIGAALVRPGLP